MKTYQDNPKDLDKNNILPICEAQKETLDFSVSVASTTQYIAPTTQSLQIPSIDKTKVSGNKDIAKIDKSYLNDQALIKKYLASNEVYGFGEVEEFEEYPVVESTNVVIQPDSALNIEGYGFGIHNGGGYRNFNNKDFKNLKNHKSKRPKTQRNKVSVKQKKGKGKGKTLFASRSKKNIN
jgi:hypothetical protein